VTNAVEVGVTDRDLLLSSYRAVAICLELCDEEGFSNAVEKCQVSGFVVGELY
jgi:hypothetical protein